MSTTSCPHPPTAPPGPREPPPLPLPHRSFRLRAQVGFDDEGRPAGASRSRRVRRRARGLTATQPSCCRCAVICATWLGAGRGHEQEDRQGHVRNVDVRLSRSQKTPGRWRFETKHTHTRRPVSGLGIVITVRILPFVCLFESPCLRAPGSTRTARTRSSTARAL